MDFPFGQVVVTPGALQALQKASEGEKLDARAIEVGIIVEGERFRRLSETEVGQYLSRMPTAS